MRKNFTYRTDENLIRDIKQMAINKNVPANVVLDSAFLLLDFIDSLEENDELFSLKNELRKFLCFDDKFIDSRGLNDES